MSKKDTNTFSHFFNEDQDVIKDVLQKSSSQEIKEVVGIQSKKILPTFKKVDDISEEEKRKKWQKIRSFFRNANNEKELSGLSPVTLSPLYTEDMVATDYPVWMENADSDTTVTSCQPLKKLIETALGDVEAPILRQNVERIVHLAIEHLEKQQKDFDRTINSVLETLDNQLEISGEDSKKFKDNLKYLKSKLPITGSLLPYSINASFQLLEAAMNTSISPGINKTKIRTTKQVSKLNDLLRIEEEKGPERKDPTKLKESMSFVDSMMKFDQLSSMMPEGGGESMGIERVNRIKEVVNKLMEADKILEQFCFLFVDKSIYDINNIDWDVLFKKAELNIIEAGKGSDSIMTLFSERMSAYTKFVIAGRIAELELANKYQADVHDEYFANFHWQNFTKEELNTCAHYVMIVDDEYLFDKEYNKLSQLLAENIPIKLVAIKRDDHSSTITEGKEEKYSSLHSQAELGALMLSHKNIYVAQSTPITPVQLFNEFQEGLTAFAPSFFYIINADTKIHSNPYLWTSAAIESRDFPGFTFNGLLGTPWGSRFNVENNPQPTSKWPSQELEILKNDGESSIINFSFTFADKAVLNPSYHNYFYAVDESGWNDDLIPLHNYIDQTEEDNIGKVPYIWMIDGDNYLQKIAVSWPMVMATQERLDFWRFLQENSGINNFHVHNAVETAKEEMKAAYAIEVEKLKEDHSIEIEKIKNEEADNVMENLTAALLNMDLTNIAGSNAPIQKPVVVSEPEVNSQTKLQDIPNEINELDDLISSDPYIDTALCTTCNECINMNGALFNYNADKMAFIADPKAGSFKELVEAAELCPVGIIHPGSPLNPEEAGLEDLIKRAEQFN